jgi:N6-adenosine-specific RNA methylase IME4
MSRPTTNNYGPYSVILADPPWRFRVRSRKGLSRSAENHYPTLTLPEIQALGVQNLAARACVLFLWVPMPQLHEGLATMKAWGFTYKTVAFTWVKINRTNPRPFMGLGYWTRANAELCLLGTRGTPHRVAKNVAQIILAPRQRHSAKPVEIYQRIADLLGPDQTRVELFARAWWPGWHSWGNEVLSHPVVAEALSRP